MKSVKWIVASFLIFSFLNKANALPSKDIKAVKEQSQKVINSRERFNTLQAQEAVAKNKLETYENDIRNQRAIITDAQDRFLSSDRTLLARKIDKTQIEMSYKTFCDARKQQQIDFLNERRQQQISEQSLRRIRDGITTNIRIMREANTIVNEVMYDFRQKQQCFFLGYLVLKSHLKIKLDLQMQN
ncbi:MAG: hypothetical protein LBD61_05275 [Endomicrobium sp.]|jgi:hypothetical protein|nr:hypothetical protein [Endomicrobium sp.]